MHNMEISTLVDSKHRYYYFNSLSYFLSREAGVLHTRVLFYREVLEMDVIKRKELPYSVFKG